MKENTKLVLLSLAIILFVALVIIFKDNNDTKVDVKQTENDNQTEVLDLMRIQFISGCTEDGVASYKYCRCVFEDIHKKLGAEKFLKEADRYNTTGIIPDVMYESSIYCYDRL